MKVKQIITTTIDKDIEIIGATLLSAEDAEILLTKEERVYKNFWWLRTPGYFSYYACYVYSNGVVNNNGHSVNYYNSGVRPALKIDISSSDIKAGDVFIFGGKEFKVISPKLAWMHKEDIGLRAFHNDCNAEEVNNYKASDVKKFVDEWFEKTINEKCM